MNQEKDKFEEEEADDLINFAEGLDFDEYVGAPDRRMAKVSLLPPSESRVRERHIPKKRMRRHECENA